MARGARVPADADLWPALPLIFTFGVLILASGPAWQLFVIPTLWALIGISAALDLGMVEDLALFPAAVVAIGMHVRALRALRFRPKPS